MMNPIAPTSSSSSCGPPVASVKDGDLGYLESVLAMYDTRRTSLDDATTNSNKRINELHKEKYDIQRELSKLQAGGPSATMPSRDVTIVLNVEDASSPITLMLTYIVSNASWSPSYDVRISSEDNSMALTYFGRVQQSTGENWGSCDISLSTATPSLGGTPPELPQKQIIIKPKYVHQLEVNLESLSIPFAGTSVRKKKARRRAPEREEKLMEMDDFEEPEPEASVSTASVQKSGAGAATFVIPRKASIGSDNKPHKLTIAVISLNPHFMHYTAPGLSPHAYLQTRTPNTSDYPLLASDQVSVFFDGNFVTTSSMKHVSPGESFHSFLGVDSSVKVDYRPVRQTKSTTGMWSKLSSVRYDHRTVITNNKQQPIEIIVAKVFPRSSDDRIKIRLISPTQETINEEESKMAENRTLTPTNDVEVTSIFDEHMRDANGRQVNSIMHNKLTNNMVWARTIESGRKEDFIFSYSVSHPSDEEIEEANA